MYHDLELASARANPRHRQLELELMPGPLGWPGLVDTLEGQLEVCLVNAGEQH